jgi:hypothetical protein
MRVLRVMFCVLLIAGREALKPEVRTVAKRRILRLPARSFRQRS